MKTKKNQPFFGNDKLQKVVLHRNQMAINDLTAQLDTLKPYVRELVKSYYQTPFAKENTSLGDIYRNGVLYMKQYAMNSIPDETLKIGKLSLNKQKLVDSGILQLEIFGEFQSAYNNCFQRKLDDYLQYFKIENGDAVINPEAVEAFADMHSIIVQTYEEHMLLNQWNDFINAVLEFNKTLHEKCGQTIVQVDEKRASGVINFAAWCMVNKEGLPQVNGKLFESLAKGMKRRNINNMQEPEA